MTDYHSAVLRNRPVGRQLEKTAEWDEPPLNKPVISLNRR